MPRPDWAHSAQTRIIPQRQPAAPSEPAAAMESRGDERSPLFHKYWTTLKNEPLAGYYCGTVRARPLASQEDRPLSKIQQSPHGQPAMSLAIMSNPHALSDNARFVHAGRQR